METDEWERHFELKACLCVLSKRIECTRDNATINAVTKEEEEIVE